MKDWHRRVSQVDGKVATSEAVEQEERNCKAEARAGEDILPEAVPDSSLLLLLVGEAGQQGMSMHIVMFQPGLRGDRVQPALTR